MLLRKTLLNINSCYFLLVPAVITVGVRVVPVLVHKSYIWATPIQQIRELCTSTGTIEHAE